MKSTEIKVGGIYVMKHTSGLIRTKVNRIERIEPMRGFGLNDRRTITRYYCTNLTTGHDIVVRSAVKFKREA